MEKHVYTFFIAGGSELAVRALANFDRLVRPRLEGGCTLTVVDILKEPRQAREHRIVATPMLVREHPLPVVRILGDLSEAAKVLDQLGLIGNDDSAIVSTSRTAGEER
ncbi:Circadian clock protein KaiB [Anatilimnocola aggregata]|uniref:Circadian clock protein KaiB n=1 Tax=Anatilimnocola aggregata TaxID=2528021 RepID=A0A517Y9Y9_9BACT|nr:circadian clock KaiB family protein [Anatilimnocola aggregata]QDU27057.1 Circadian clock protein KaiB [Anatilimnocola aggregata]